MADPIVLGLSIGLSVVGLIALAAALVLARRSGATKPGDDLEKCPPVMPCAGPIARLDFSQSLDPALFAEAAEQEALVYARVNLSHLVDAANITLQTLRRKRPVSGV